MYWVAKAKNLTDYFYRIPKDILTRTTKVTIKNMIQNLQKAKKESEDIQTLIINFNSYQKIEIL